MAISNLDDERPRCYWSVWGSAGLLWGCRMLTGDLSVIYVLGSEESMEHDTEKRRTAPCDNMSGQEDTE